MARPRDSHRLRLHKAPHRSRDELEMVEDAIVAPMIGDPPDWLHPLAVEEWHRVALELRKKEWFGAIDETLLARYCQSYARWREAEADIDARGNTLRVTDKEAGKDWIRENPSVKIAMRWASDMERCAARFGISPGARQGWTQPKPTETAQDRLEGALG